MAYYPDGTRRKGSRLRQMLEAYGRGEVEAPEVIALLPPRTHPDPSKLRSKELTEDVGEYNDDTWDEVSVASATGVISSDQYRELFDLYTTPSPAVIPTVADSTTSPTTPEAWQRRLDELFPDGCVVSWMGPGDDYGDDDVHVMHVPRIIVEGSMEDIVGDPGENGTTGSVALRLHGPDAGKVAQAFVHIMEPYTGDDLAPEDAIALRGTQPWFFVVSGEITDATKQWLAEFRKDPEWADEFVSPVLHEEPPRHVVLFVHRPQASMRPDVLWWQSVDGTLVERVIGEDTPSVKVARYLIGSSLPNWWNQMFEYLGEFIRTADNWDVRHITESPEEYVADLLREAEA